MVTEEDGGDLDLFETQDHEKNDGHIFHARFRSKTTSKVVYHGGRRRRSKAIKPGTSEQFGSIAHLAISKSKPGFSNLVFGFFILL